MNISKILISLIFTLILFGLIPSSAHSQSNEAIDYYNKGISCHENGQITLAIQNYNKALNLYSGFTGARYNLGIAYHDLANKYSQQGQYDLAIQNYKQAIKYNNEDASAYYNLAVTYDRTGQTLIAIENYKKSLSLNPELNNAKRNLCAAYFDLGNNYYNHKDFDSAIQAYNNAISIDSRDAQAYSNLGLAYSYNAQPDLAIKSYNKAISLDPMNGDLYKALADVYANNNNFDLALINYEKALKLKPNDHQILHNMQVSQRRKNDNELTSAVNNVKALQKAPKEVYDLVKLDNGVKYISLIKCNEILDMIWSDPDGQKLLKTMINHKIPIKITQGTFDTNSKVQTKEYKQSVALLGLIPIYSWNTGSQRDIVVNIGEDYVLAFRNPNLSTDQRIFAFHVFIHEFCHAVSSTFAKQDTSSLEEEISASMIGYNIASRLLRGRDLTKDETYEYSQRCLQGILMDDHRLLPVYNNFNIQIQGYGITPPHLYLYRNIAELYRSIRLDSKTNRLDTLEKML